VYDQIGVYSVCRAAYMFKYFGAKNVKVLNGGLKGWKGETESGINEYVPEKQEGGDFEVVPQEESKLVKSMKDMNDIVFKNLNPSAKGDTVQIIDTRSAARFSGAEPEPTPTFRQGCIETSTCLPFNKVLTDNAFFKTEAEILSLFEEA
jgi:thiosulfate/3-mercaptopyruvate sulfurtransferase